MKNSLVIACNAWADDEMGGAYRIASEFAVHCARKGHDTHYVSMHAGSARRVEYDRKDGVHLWRYPGPANSGGGKSARNLFGHWKGAQEAAKLIRGRLGKSAPVVLNGHTALQYWGLLDPLRGMLKRKVLSVHSPLTAEYLAEKNSKVGAFRDRLALAALSRIEKKIYRASDLILCDSLYTKKRLEADFPSETARRAVVCPGYADAREDLLALSRHDARRKLPAGLWSDNVPYFFTARRLVPRTGVDALIRAAAWIKNTDRASFRVMIAGQGPLSDEYKALSRQLCVADEVRFLGSISEEELRLSHRAADCFVLPTRELECFGLVILEAFASGTPVIATPIGAIPELMAPAPEGLARDNSPEALGERMLAFLRSGGQRDAAHAAKYVAFAKNYEKTKILDRLEVLVMGGENI
jgi:glycosyltransferase involved in cell wall biosynthesis